MDTIEYNLPPFQKERKKNLKVKVTLFTYAEALFDELSSMGIIERIKKVPQLGPIKVSAKLKKSRYDYMILQLYFHQLINENDDMRLKMASTYSNKINVEQFGNPNMTYLEKERPPTKGEVLQLLTVIYNIGHFFNTFTASRAVVMFAEKSPTFKKILIESSSSERFQESAKKILSRQDYHHLHLLNSLLLLERCNQENVSVLWAQEIIYAYLNKESLPKESKLHYAFEIFQTVRDVSFVAYDLQVANTPFIFDLWNIKAVKFLFEELLSIYNNQLPSYNLIESIKKMLDDTLYNENFNAIYYYQISKDMVSKFNEVSDIDKLDYFSDCWDKEDSILNRSYKPDQRYAKDPILKLTFNSEEKDEANNLLLALSKVEFLKVGYYDRYSGDRTVLASIKEKCTNKKDVAFRVLRKSIQVLRKNPTILPDDRRFLIISKFFIFYLFSEMPVVIKPTVDKNICALCTRGKCKRIEQLSKLEQKKTGKNYQLHETNFMIKYLEQDLINDTVILLPASIVVYEKDGSNYKSCEFDGIIIYPMRKKVTFLEAKDTSGKSSYAKKCLSDKLKKLGIQYEPDEIISDGHDAAIQISI